MLVLEIKNNILKNYFHVFSNKIKKKNTLHYNIKMHIESKPFQKNIFTLEIFPFFIIHIYPFISISDWKE